MKTNNRLATPVVTVWLASLALLALIAPRIGDLTARGLWSLGAPPSTALPLLRRDAQLAMRIGNYYFSGGAYDLAAAEHYSEHVLVIDQKISDV